MNMPSVFCQLKPTFLGLALLLLPVLTALACRYYFHQQAAKDKVEFYQQSLEIMYQRQAQNLPAGSLLFFGDSQIQGLAVTAISPKAVNFGIGHQQLRQLAQTISNYPGLARADKIIIGIGINDLLQATVPEPEQAIAKLLTALQCCSDKVVLLSVLPVNETTLGKPGLNQRITRFNQHFKAAALTAGTRYIELSDTYADGGGHLSANYDLGDGLHLSRAGYAAMIQQIKSELQQSNSYAN